MISASATSTDSSTGFFSAVARLAPVRLVVLLALFVGAGFAQLSRLPALRLPDIWRHLSVGTWILDNRSIPHHVLFSQNLELPWVDSSWLFDALTSTAVKVFGLRGLLLLGLAFALAIAVAVFVLARGPRRGFWSGAALTALGVYLLAGLPLRSSFASVVLFTVSLALIASARSTAGGRSFYLLPPLFLLWSNLDIQFVYGLTALVLFLIIEVIANFAERKGPQQQNLHPPWRATLLVTAASFAATLSNPYGFHLWGAALRSVSPFGADPYMPRCTPCVFDSRRTMCFFCW